MPYEGDSPAEAWEYWFDEPPNVNVRAWLTQYGLIHSAPDIIEAIGITGMRFSVEGEESRLRYVGGILRRNSLAKIAPERAEEERQTDIILAYWNKAAISVWPLSRKQVRGWLQYIPSDAIKAAIHTSASWREFKDLIDSSIAKTDKHQQECAEANAKAEAEAKAESARKLMVLLPRGRRRRK